MDTSSKKSLLERLLIKKVFYRRMCLGLRLDTLIKIIAGRSVMMRLKKCLKKAFLINAKSNKR